MGTAKNTEWQHVTFADIAESITERVDDPKEAGVEVYVGLEHLDSNTTRIIRFGTPDEVEASKLRFYPGDVIYARRRAYQRKLGVAEVEGICSAHALVLRARPDVCLPEFLPYFLQSDQFHERALEISVGSLSPTINWKTLRVQEFVLPPVEEQKRLATLMSELDSVISKLEEIPFDSLLGSIWHSVLTEGSSNVTTFGVECDVKKGKKPDRLEEIIFGASPYLTADVLRTKRFRNYVSDLDQGNLITSSSEDTILLWDGAGAGDIFLGQNGVVASTMARVRPKTGSRLSPSFLYFHLLFLSDQIKATCRGSTVPHVDPHILRELNLVAPDERKQLETVQLLTSVLDLQSESSRSRRFLMSMRSQMLNEFRESTDV